MAVHVVLFYLLPIVVRPFLKTVDYGGDDAPAPLHYGTRSDFICKAGLKGISAQQWQHGGADSPDHDDEISRLFLWTNFVMGMPPGQYGSCALIACNFFFNDNSRTLPS